MTSLPTWAIYCVSFGAPAAAFLGALIGHLVSRKGATELDTWQRREETMRMLRWAAELAVTARPSTAWMGLAALEALTTSELLQPADRALVDLVARSVVRSSLREYREDYGDRDVRDVVVDPAVGEGG